jgi:hypothetical protein
MSDQAEGSDEKADSGAATGNGENTVAALKTEDDTEVAGKTDGKTQNAANEVAPPNPGRFSRTWGWVKTKASEAHLADWSLVLFTFIIAASTITYTVYAKRQWKAMSDQLVEMKKSGVDTGNLAIAAGKQADAAKAQSEQARAQTEKMGAALAKTDKLIEQATAQARAANALADNAGKQAGVMQRQLAEMQASRSPWLGIEDNSIALSQPDFRWLPGANAHPSIFTGVSYTIKNFGTSPAFHEADMMMVIELEPNATIPPTQRIDTACQFSEMAGANAGAANPGAGRMIFPGARTPVSAQTNLQLVSGEPHHINGMWFFICIAYRDSQGTPVHHSRYWYLSTPIAAPVIPIPGHPGWTYTAITGANLWGADAN